MANESILKNKSFVSAIKEAAEAISPKGAFNDSKSSFINKSINKSDRFAKQHDIIDKIIDRSGDGEISKHSQELLKRAGIKASNREELAGAFRKTVSNEAYFKDKANMINKYGAFKGGNLKDNATIFAGGVKNYYDPRSNSIKTMAARYGATAGIIGGGALAVHTLNNHDERDDK